jgi:hypothetical protein
MVYAIQISTKIASPAPKIANADPIRVVYKAGANKIVAMAFANQPKVKIAQPAPKIALAHPVRFATKAIVERPVAMGHVNQPTAKIALPVPPIASANHRRSASPANADPAAVTEHVRSPKVKIARPAPKIAHALPVCTATMANVALIAAMAPVKQQKAKIAQPAPKIANAPPHILVKMALVYANPIAHKKTADPTAVAVLVVHAVGALSAKTALVSVNTNVPLAANAVPPTPLLNAVKLIPMAVDTADNSLVREAANAPTAHAAPPHVKANNAAPMAAAVLAALALQEPLAPITNASAHTNVHDLANANAQVVCTKNV